MAKAPELFSGFHSQANCTQSNRAQSSDCGHMGGRNIIILEPLLPPPRVYTSRELES